MKASTFSHCFSLCIVCFFATNLSWSQEISSLQDHSGQAFFGQQFDFGQASTSAGVNPYAFIQAENFTDQDGVQVVGNNNASGVAYINNGDYIKFEQVVFGNGPQSGVILASSSTIGGSVEFRLDNPGGPLIATSQILNTGTWTSLTSFAISVINPGAYSSGTEALGTRDLYLVFTGGNGFLMAIDRFRFIQAQVALQEINITDCPTAPVSLGSALSLNVETVPSGASNQSLIFSVNNPSLLSLANGVYSAAAVGELTVTVASALDASVLDVCTITITETTVVEDLRVLIYHETNGFRHASINAGIAMIEEFGVNNGWTVEQSQSSDIFTDANLATASVVVWLNTSGNGLLTANERAAFEQYIQNGGGFVGVHAATDTYRDGSWPWYNDLVGAIVQTGPNHTSNNFNATMDVVGSHPAVTHLGTEWNKNEEYYYWELNGGYLFGGNIDLLQVRSTGSQSYDAPRPITWYKIFDGGRSFYTALGHNASDYSGDEDFRTMVEQAILWAGGAIDLALHTGNANPDAPNSGYDVVAYPNPVDGILNVYMDGDGPIEGRLMSINGTVLREIRGVTNSTLDLSDLSSGTYLLHLKQGNQDKRVKIVKR